MMVMTKRGRGFLAVIYAIFLVGLPSLFADTLRQIKQDGTCETLFQEILSPCFPDEK